ncbi:MAG: NUDIX domain-containing protein [Candidatus Spechtbacterales bacterium]
MAIQEQSFGVIPVLQEGDALLFLLVQHAYRSGKNKHHGHWAFPKGHAENGEDALAAARRELEEETGIVKTHLLKEPRFQERYHFQQEGDTIAKTVTYFIGLVSDGTVHPQEEEVQDFAWLPYEQALRRLTFKEGRRMLEEAHAYLQSAGGLFPTPPA